MLGLTFQDIQSRLEHKKSRQDIIYTKLDDKNPVAHVSSSNRFAGPQVPTVRSTLSEDEDEDETLSKAKPPSQIGSDKHRQESRHEDNWEKTSKYQATNSPGAQALRIKKAQPRRFHLSKLPLEKRARLSSSEKSAVRYVRNVQDEIAVFIERTTGEAEHPSTDSIMHDTEEMQDSQEPSHESTYIHSTPRKRPTPSAVEKRWRAETWGTPKPASKEPLSIENTVEELGGSTYRWNQNSTKLAEQLHSIALQETMPALHSNLSQIQDTNQPRIQSKVPSERSDGKHYGVNMTDLASDVDDTDEGYVYDTYIRQIKPRMKPAESFKDGDEYFDPLQEAGNENIGLLVINEEDKELWDTYGEVEEDEDDIDSEDPDENGRYSLHRDTNLKMSPVTANVCS